MMHNSIGERFIDETKTIEINQSDQAMGVPPPALQSPYEEGLEEIKLTKIENLKMIEKDITHIINQRKSSRVYSENSLTLEELSYLLWCTQGVKKIISNISTKRTVPSAGSRHPLETYIAINKVGRLPVGLYRYIGLQHKLIKIQEDPKIMQKIVACCNSQKFIGKSALVFIWSTNIYRMKWRHGERSYRYVFLEAGHVCQNLYLSAAVVNCGVCAISVFIDDMLNKLLKIDGKKEFTIYAAAVGKNKTP
jgi:SagB-type dehydrogenase family enzyme